MNRINVTGAGGPAGNSDTNGQDRRVRLGVPLACQKNQRNPLIEVNRVRVGGIEGEAELWSWVEAEESERKFCP